jgi:hypothetical protein
MITPPKAKPSIVRVKGSVAAARGTPNSACTAGSATTTDHMPTPPTVDTSMVAPSRSHAWAESGAGCLMDCGFPNDSIGRHLMPHPASSIPRVT